MTALTSAVETVTHGNWWSTAKKAGNTFMNFTFGCGQDSIFLRSMIKDKKGVREAWTESKMGESWWGSLKKAFTPSAMKEEWKGLEGGALKKFGQFFHKRMPFIGTASCLVLTEIPNAYRAFTDKEHGGGIWTGIKETAKAAFKCSVFAAGAALGGLISGGFLGVAGSIAGGLAGSWIADKIAGKSFTEKKEAIEEAKANAVKQAQQQTQGQTQEQTQSAQQNETQKTGNSSSTSNPFGQSFSGNNPFQVDWKDRDLMAMSAGLA